MSAPFFLANVAIASARWGNRPESGRHPHPGAVKDPSLASGDPCRNEAVFAGYSDAGIGPSPESRNGVYPEHPVVSNIIEMVGYKYRPVPHMHHPMKIVQNEKSRKPDTDPPERIRNPRVQVIVAGRRCVIGNYRRSFACIIILDYHFFRVVARLGSISLAGIDGCGWNDLQTEIGAHRRESL